MRKLLLAVAAAAAMLAAQAIAPQRAEAMTIGGAAGIRTAVDTTSLTDEVRYVCRWRCGPYGCRRVCWWRPGGYYYYRPYYRRHYWRRW